MFKLAVVLSLVSSAWAASHPAFWRYSHPQARALVGVDLSAVSKSPLGQRLSEELGKMGLKQTAADQGLDFVSDIDRVLISTPASGNSEHAPVVIALQGRFDLAKLRKTVLGKGARRGVLRGVEFLQPDRKDTDMVLALVSPQVLLVGDRRSIDAAIAHHARADVATAESELFERAVELSQMYDVWFAAEASPAELAAGQAPGAEVFSMLTDVETFEGGISFRNGLGLEFSFNTQSEDAARKLGTAVMGLVQLASLGNRDKQPEMADLLQKLRVGVAGDQVTLAVAYTQAEIERGFDQAKLAWVGQTAPASGRRFEPAPQDPAGGDPDRPFVVKIFNAEGGNREHAFPKQ